MGKEDDGCSIPANLRLSPPVQGRQQRQNTVYTSGCFFFFLGMPTHTRSTSTYHVWYGCTRWFRGGWVGEEGTLIGEGGICMYICI